MQNEIVQKEAKVLREVAKEVPVEDIKGRKIATVIRRMQKALDSQEDGVAIAAPQVGENLRIFVISKRIFEIMDEEKMRDSKASTKDKIEAAERDPKQYKDLVFINPEIMKLSKKQALIEEGCLSVRWLYGKVKRADKALVKAYDENGKQFTMGGSGLLAQAFQHETDHLNGVLFTDKAVDLKEMPPTPQA